MACYHPLVAWINREGRAVFAQVDGCTRELQLPCGQCIGCRVDRKRAWTTRLVHESQMHDESCFITLTYDDAHLPRNGSLHYPDVQKFLRALRKARKGTRIRYYVVGEYGGETDRPHYHALLFGVRFADLVVHSQNRDGHTLFLSPELTKLWKLGNHLIGEVTPYSAAYCAGYCTKKITGEHADLHYRRVDPSSGELVQIVPEFSRMSLKPAIGLEWFKKYSGELHVHDGAVVGGQVQPTPRYYDKLTKDRDGETWESLSYKRYLRSLEFRAENAPDRLAAREAVAEAKFKLRKRKL